LTLHVGGYVGKQAEKKLSLSNLHHDYGQLAASEWFSAGKPEHFFSRGHTIKLHISALAAGV